MKRCERCGREIVPVMQRKEVDGVLVCEPCTNLILREWLVRKRDFVEMTQS